VLVRLARDRGADSLASCRARRVDPLAVRREDRVTGSCASQSTWTPGARRAAPGDREVAPGVAEPDRRREVEHLAGPAQARVHVMPAGRSSAGSPARRSRQRAVHPDRVARLRAVPGPLEQRAGRPGRLRAASLPPRGVIASSCRARRAPGQRMTRSSPACCPRPRDRLRVCLGDERPRRSVPSAQPTPSSICFVECGSGKISAVEELGEPRQSRRQRAVVQRPALVGVELRPRRSGPRARADAGSQRLRSGR
jgi:hypothetical protein